MIDLRHRSYEKELMDGDNIPFPAMQQTLKELNMVNTWLGGHAITLKAVKELRNEAGPLIICEIGCGGGDNLQAIYKKYADQNIPVQFIGIDINEQCIAYAKQQYPHLPCKWICSDYALVNFKEEEKPAVIFSSLFCHHFTDEQLVFMLKWLQQNCRIGFFINDLHRHWLAFYLIKYITKFFSRSYLVKNDASLSVARSFRKNDWQRLLQMADIHGYDISWQWAFRWLVLAKQA